MDQFLLGLSSFVFLLLCLLYTIGLVNTFIILYCFEVDGIVCFLLLEAIFMDMKKP